MTPGARLEVDRVGARPVPAAQPEGAVPHLGAWSMTVPRWSRRTTLRSGAVVRHVSVHPGPLVRTLQAEIGAVGTAAALPA